MRNQEIKIQRNNGYMLNSTNKQLERFEFISCKFNFTANSVKYKCRLGGMETMIENNNLQVYANESNYKANNPLPPFALTFDDAMRRAYGFESQWHDEKPYAWEYKNGDALMVEISAITFSFCDSCTIEKDDNYQIYESHLRVFDFHDLVIKEDDGTIKVQKAPANKLIPNDEQKALIEELQVVLQKLNNADMKIVFDHRDAELYALPMGNIQAISNWDDGEHSYIQIQDMIPNIKNANISTFNSEDSGLLVTFKE